MKKYLILCFTLCFGGMLAAQQFYSVKNPNEMKPEGSPRAQAVVEQEKAQCLATLDAINKYMKTNGVEKSVQEINKGRQGAFGAQFPKSHFYLSLARKKGASGWPIIAHGSNPALVGFDVPDVSVFVDNTGWQYLVDMFKIKNPSKIGVIDGLLWADPEWANGKKCRMYAYNTFQTIGADEYWLYMAIWLDA